MVLNLELLKALSSIVGMLGGILGFFVFIDNYILKFKPRLNISNTLFFRYKPETKHLNDKGRDLESVILKVEAINKRNKIGRIDDFAIRVYDSRSTSPSGYMLYAENVLDELPSTISDLNNVKFNSFSPISILGKSNSNFIIEFKHEKYLSSSLNLEGSLKLDLLYYQSKKGWKVVGSFNPHNYKDHEATDDPNGIIEYSLLDSAITRKAASKSLKEPEIGLYKGVSGKYLGFYLMKPVWFIKRAITYPIKVFKLLFALIEVVLRQLLASCVVLPLLKLKSKKLPRMQFGSAKSHLIEETELSLKKLKANIEKISTKINGKADSEAEIIVRDEKGSFIIQRGRLEVKFYKSGDGHIRANDTAGYPQMFSFSMELIEYPLGVRLWKINNKTMTINSACVHIMDSFILLAH